MGQQMGHMPESWSELMEEKDRILRWSGEVLAGVDDNITSEDMFLMDYDNSKIDKKVDQWVSSNEDRINQMCDKIPNFGEENEQYVNNSIEKIKEELGIKMRKDYLAAYKDSRKFTKKVDTLGADQRKVHSELQVIEERVDNIKSFQKKFAPLRHKSFNNFRNGKKMLFEDQKLKTEFARRVSDIDKKNLIECDKKFERLLEDLKKQVAK